MTFAFGSKRVGLHGSGTFVEHDGFGAVAVPEHGHDDVDEDLLADRFFELDERVVVRVRRHSQEDVVRFFRAFGVEAAEDVRLGQLFLHFVHGLFGALFRTGADEDHVAGFREAHGEPEAFRPRAADDGYTDRA